MLEQNRELIKKYEAEKKEMGMLAIAQGDGIINHAIAEKGDSY